MHFLKVFHTPDFPFTLDIAVMDAPARVSWYENFERQRNLHSCGIYSTGKTALHEAAEQGNLRIVEPLLEEGVSVHETVMNHASMFHGQTAIDIAAFYGEVEMVRKLHECGGCLGRKRGGKTTLYYAVSTSRYDLVKLLLELGACVDEESEVDGLEGVTALHIAAEKSRDEIVTLLLHHRADVQKVKIDGRGALHCAAMYNRLIVAALLLEAGSFVNQRTNIGVSVLFEAASRGYSAMVALLLRYGADTKSSISTGATPYSIAESRGYADVLRVFNHALVARTWAWQMVICMRKEARFDRFIKHIEEGTVPELIGQWAPELDSELKDVVFHMAARAVNDSRNAYLLFYDCNIRHVTPRATPAEGTQTKLAMKQDNSAPKQGNRACGNGTRMLHRNRYRLPLTGPLSEEFIWIQSLETATEQQPEVVKKKRFNSFIVNPTGSLRVKWELGTTIPLALWRSLTHDGLSGIRRLIISYLLHKSASVRFILREMASYATNKNGDFNLHNRTQKVEAYAMARMLKVRRINDNLRIFYEVF
jgi:hypothetical protein